MSPITGAGRSFSPAKVTRKSPESRGSGLKTGSVAARPWVEDLDAQLLEVLHVARRDDEIMMGRDGRDLQVKRRPRPAGRFGLDYQCAPSPGDAGVEGQDATLELCATTPDSHCSSVRRRAVDARRRQPATNSPNVTAERNSVCGS